MIDSALRAALAFLGHMALGVAALGVVALSAILGRPLALGEVVRLDVGGALILGALVATIEASAQRGDDPEVQSASDRRLATMTGLALAVVMCVAPAARALPFLHRAEPGGTVALLAIGLVVAGAALRARSIRVLGDAFVTEPNGRAFRTLIEHDVYAAIRHPSELGLLAICAGMTLLTSSMVAALGSVVVVALSVARIRREEAALRSFSRAAYEAYARRVPALFPSLRRRR